MKAVVVGAGIAGPVTAMALHKAGIDAEVFEAYDRAADGVGSFLTLAVNGVVGLRAIDIDPRALPGFATPRFAMYLSDGQKIGELKNGPQLADGTVSLTLKRADLYGFLRDEAARRGIRFHYGKRLVGVRNDRTGAVAEFADGSTQAADVLVGADGLKSRVRELIDPAAPKATFVGLLNFGGYARGVELPGPTGTFHMIFGRRCFFAWLKNPNGEVWWFANPWRAQEPTEAELRETSADAWRAELIDLFSADRSAAVELIRATPTITGGWAAYDFRRVPVWHRDRCVIVGDAAHAASPSSGQGSSMAIEDAVVLAKSLRDLPTVEGALARYERLRRDRVERVVRQGRRNGTGKSPGVFGRVVRDFFMPHVFKWLERKGEALSAWLYEYPLDWHTTVAPSGTDE